MAHTLYTPEQAARSVLAALRYLTTLPRTVRMDFSSEFIAGRGQTVNVKAPITAGKARVYTTAQRDAREAIQFNDLTETWVPVKLDQPVYNAVRLPVGWATFTLADLQTQVIRPQAESVVDELATPLVTEMSAITNESGDGAIPTITTGNALSVIIRAGQILNQRKVPREGRVLAVGSAVEAILLNVPQLQKANESGDDADMLRRATIGNLFGFTIVADYSLAENFAIAYHRDAFAFVTRVPVVPKGAAFGQVIAQDGFSLRHIMHYNPSHIEDQSIVDAFCGAATLDAKRAVSFTAAA